MTDERQQAGGPALSRRGQDRDTPDTPHCLSDATGGMTAQSGRPSMARAFDQLADVLVPPGGALVAIAEVYVDESGSHSGSPILSVGGYVFLKSRSRLFSHKWEGELRRVNAPYFHMTDCANGRAHYKSWPMEQRIQHETCLTRLTKKYSTFGFATGINELVYQDIMGSGQRRWEADTHSCFGVALLRFALGLTSKVLAGASRTSSNPAIATRRKQIGS